MLLRLLIVGGIQTLSSVGSHEKRTISNHSQENLNEPQSLMARSSRTNISEEYDSDFDDLSNEDEEPSTRRDSLYENSEEKRKQMLLEVSRSFEEKSNFFSFDLQLRQQQILAGIVQEWLRKEESYLEQLKKMNEQVKNTFLLSCDRIPSSSLVSFE